MTEGVVLSEDQRAVLALLRRQGRLATQMISRLLSQRPDWAYSRVLSLQRKKLVDQDGETFTRGHYWRPTPQLASPMILESGRE